MILFRDETLEQNVVGGLKSNLVIGFLLKFLLEISKLYRSRVAQGNFHDMSIDYLLKSHG